MKKLLSAAKTDEEWDEIKESFKGKVGPQPKDFFPSDRVNGESKHENKRREKERQK